MPFSRLRMFSILNFILLMSSVTFAGKVPHHDFFEKYPVTQIYHLESGEQVGLPFHIYQSEFRMIMGTVDLKKAQKYLASENIKMAQITGNKGLMAIYLVKYNNTVIGSYNEVLTAFLTDHENKSDNSSLKSLLGAVSIFFPGLQNFLGKNKNEVGFFAWKLWVDSDLALRAGREIWGFNKTIAKIDYESSSKRSLISASDEAGPIFDSYLKSVLPVPSLFPLQMKFRVTTPVEYKQTTTPSLVKGWSVIHPFTKNDHFHINADNVWGAKLKEVDFKPLAWIETDDGYGFLGAPLQ